MSEASEPILTAGVDPGTGAVKVAVVRSHAGVEGEILATSVQRFRRRDVAPVVELAFSEACAAAGVRPGDFAYVASTGDGDVVPFRTGHFYTMTTHGRGGLHYCPRARAVLDVGALHARALLVDERGRVLRHRMTSQCASGSGQFLENIARYLGVPLEDVGSLSLQATRPEKVSSICAVLAETDVINMVSRGIGAADILQGIHQSIAGRLAQLLRAVGAEGTVMVTGGLSQDRGLLSALGEALQAPRGRLGPMLGLEVVTHPDAVLAGAVGAALLGAYRFRQLEESGRFQPATPQGAPA